MQEYLQHEHYALWEVIEFRDSYEVPANDPSTTTTNTTSGEAGLKSGRTVTLTTKDMQKKKNDATKKTKKNLLKQQYGNFRAEGSENLEQTFTRLQVIVGQLQFMDVEIEQDDLNQKFLTEVQKKMEPNTQNMAFISSAKHSRGNDEVNTASVYTARSNVPTASANVANECIETLKKELETLKQENEVVDGKLAGLLTASKDLDNLIESQRSDKSKEGLGYTTVPPLPAQLYLSPKKDLSLTGLTECAGDTVTNYSRPSPTVESSSEED
nr:hypothetical protein [Tanacetum cinerariifolium]